MVFTLLTSLTRSNSCSHPQETKYCTRKANRRSPETTWFTTKIWNKCMATVGWLKSSVVPHQAIQTKKAQDKWMTKEPINVSEICMAGLNQSSPVSVLLCILFLRILGIRTSTTGIRLSKEWKCSETYGRLGPLK